MHCPRVFKLAGPHALGGMILMVTLTGWTVQAQDSLPLRETLFDVQQNERLYKNLYENIDVLVERVYHVGDQQSLGIRRFNPRDRSVVIRPVAGVLQTDDPIRFVNQSGGPEVVRTTSTIHFVSQGGKVRLEWKSNSILADGARSSRHHILCYDGRATRLYDKSPISHSYEPNALLRSGRIEPHMLLLRPLALADSMGRSLSACLEGDQLKSVTYQGQEEYRGQQCRKVWITSLRGRQQRPGVRQELWLAVARNLIPIRWREYRPAIDLPSAEAMVDEWQEVKPGVWLPMAATITKYDTIALRRDKVQKVRWRERYTVKLASLNPDYNPTYFQKLPSSS